VQGGLPCHTPALANRRRMRPLRRPPLPARGRPGRVGHGPHGSLPAQHRAAHRVLPQAWRIAAGRGYRIPQRDLHSHDSCPSTNSRSSSVVAALHCKCLEPKNRPRRGRLGLGDYLSVAWVARNVFNASGIKSAVLNADGKADSKVVIRNCPRPFDRISTIGGFPAAWLKLLASYPY
jgi:hypothetical protein